MPDSKLLIITTGGTLDKRYDPIKGQFGFGDDTHLEQILAQSYCRTAPRIHKAMLIDSLDMVDSDRLRLAEICKLAPETRIVITHGTDQMVETARVISQSVRRKKKTVVLTGAMVPWALGNSDAPFNLGTAMAFAQLLEPNVYISMHGRAFPWNSTYKDRAEGGFRDISETSG